jgi:hypothetical protein
MDSRLCQVSEAAISRDGLSRILNVIFHGILKKD